MAERQYLRLISVFALTTLAGFAGDGGKLNGVAAPTDPPGSEKPAAASAHAPVPPVLRKVEPDDSLFVVLPGAAPAKATAPIKTVAPIKTATPTKAAVPAKAPTPVKAFVAPPTPSHAARVDLAERHEPPPPELADPGPPILRRTPRPIYPEDFEKDSGMFCQKQIGQWKEDAAIALLGVPSGDRPAFDDNQKVSGRIYAFSDPTNRYKLLELDFDSETGALRTVFVYPWKMTWQDCRRMWGGDVSAAEANQGRKFYSYVNRRLDVLVDPTGKVISIGLY